MTTTAPAKRKRLSQKQLIFLNEVFEMGGAVTDALRNLRIRPSTFDRWLTNPLFLNKLRMYLNQYYLQARMELARSAPLAVSGLALLSERSMKPAELRKACNDILNIHTQLAKLSPCQGPVPRRGEGVKQVQDGITVDKFGALLAQFGVILDNNGSVSDKLGDTNTPKNRVLCTKNVENTTISHKLPHS